MLVHLRHSLSGSLCRLSNSNQFMTYWTNWWKSKDLRTAALLQIFIRCGKLLKDLFLYHLMNPICISGVPIIVNLHRRNCFWKGQKKLISIYYFLQQSKFTFAHLECLFLSCFSYPFHRHECLIAVRLCFNHMQEMLSKCANMTLQEGSSWTTEEWLSALLTSSSVFPLSQSSRWWLFGEMYSLLSLTLTFILHK